MTARQLEILQHALGVDQYGRGNMYRNHFVTGQGSDDYPTCTELVSMGLMFNHGKHSLAGGDDCFSVTDKGKVAMKMNSPAPPKLSPAKLRYQRYLRVADCFASFKDFLKYDSQRKFQS